MQEDELLAKVPEELLDLVDTAEVAEGRVTSSALRGVGFLDGDSGLVGQSELIISEGLLEEGAVAVLKDLLACLCRAKLSPVQGLPKHVVELPEHLLLLD